MAPVDVERVYAVFHLFAVAPSRNLNSNSTTDAVKEPYIPTCFLAVATREVGFYPTTAAVHQFVKSVPTATGGAVTFAAFLQFCEDVAYTNRPGRSAIYKLVDDLDTRGGGLISRRDLFLILTNGSADISDGEIDAVMELLDPTLSGYVELKDLAALLIEQCHQQRSLSRSSRSRSRPESQARSGGGGNGGGSSSSPPTEHRRHKHEQQPQPQQQQQQQQQHHNHPLQRIESRPTAEAEKPEKKKAHRRVGTSGADGTRPAHRGRRAFMTRADSRDKEARDEPVPQPPPATTAEAASSSSGATPAVVAAVERDRSFKRTDIGSNGEVGYRKYGSLYSRPDTFERTQTAMTVDVDCPLSVSGTAGRQQQQQHSGGGAGPHTPARASKRTPATAANSPQSPPPKGTAAPLPRSPASAAATPLRKEPADSGKSTTAAAVMVAAPSNADEPAADPADAAPSRIGGGDVGYAPEGDDEEEETNCFSRVEGHTVVHSKRENARVTAPPEDAPTPPAQEAEEAAVPAAPAPSNPPRAKETKTKCCAMF